MLAVQKILEKKGVSYKLIPLKQKAVSVSEVTKNALVSVPEKEVCKTVLLKTRSNQCFAVLLEGNKKIDFKKLEKRFHQKIFLLTPVEAKKESGLEPGAISPLLLKIPLFVDENVLKLKKINFGSGSQLFGIELKTKDFLRIVKPEILLLSK